MYVSLQEGLYDLCRLRIEKDEEFRAVAKNRNFDAVDDALFDEYKLYQLKKTVAWVKSRSSFYRRLYEKNGVGPEDINSLADIAKLPFTNPSDLAGTSYSFLCTSQGDVEKPVTFYSSGSTGTKKRIFFSRADIKKILDFMARGMNTVVGRYEGRVQVFMQNSQGRGIAQTLADSVKLFGMDAWTSEMDDDAENIIRLTLENHVNVWFGEAVTILRATRILARKMDLSKLGMKCIFITMTNIPQSMIDYLQKAWNCRVSTHYGLTEAGWGLAVDCDVCDGYHYNELDIILEIVDPDTGEVLPSGEAGEVVLSSIARDCMPLIRYRTGDIAKLEKSSCGSHLEVLGHIMRRKEGMYDLNGQKIYPAIFDEAIFSMEDTLDYRIFAQGDQLYFELEVIDVNNFDTARLIEKFMQLEELKGAKQPVIRLLPCGALRKYCFEKKRILPLEVAPNV